MFITVRFADDRRELFNPDCKNCLLLNNIKERCDCDEDDFIELSDESGYLKNLQSHPLDYATKYLNAREILILVKGEKTDGEHMKFSPLLEGLEANKAFLERLNPPPPQPEKIKSPTKDSPSKLYAEGARCKRVSLAPRPKQSQLAPPVNHLRSLSPGRRGSRIRSQSMQLTPAPLGAVGAARRAR